MGTLMLENPQNILYGFAITLIDNVIDAYQTVVSSRNSPRMVKNLHWLRRLRERLYVRMAKTPEESNGDSSESAHGDVDKELPGWRTRLISGAVRGLQVSNAIRADTVSNGSSDLTHSAGIYQQMKYPSNLHGQGNAWDSEVRATPFFKVAVSY